MQVIPELAKEVAELTVYQRTPIWVMPKLDFGFSPAVQRLFARVPLTQRILRWFTDTAMEFMMVIAMWKFRYFQAESTSPRRTSPNCIGFCRSVTRNCAAS